MRIAVFAATGATGRQLTHQALERGHTVVALARTPSRLALPASPTLELVTADVLDPQSVARALVGVDAVVSGLGNTDKGKSGVLVAGATSLADALRQGTAPRVVWLGAFGTGVSAEAAGPLSRVVLKLALGAEIPDKTAADDLMLRAGATVFHAARLTNGPLSSTRHTVALAEVPRRLVPPGISRATVAAQMLDEAEVPRHAGQVAVPLS